MLSLTTKAVLATVLLALCAAAALTIHNSATLIADGHVRLKIPHGTYVIDSQRSTCYALTKKVVAHPGRVIAGFNPDLLVWASWMVGAPGPSTVYQVPGTAVADGVAVELTGRETAHLAKPVRLSQDACYEDMNFRSPGRVLVLHVDVRFVPKAKS